ncbi:uncharacterized protein KY384_000112 [Bacidia gigantensis]|uniref:uncharacterized protein n=1 Tax=Bacidia gigantensis TaxID=2732470 RepID=UPI001D039A3B|nr:uncharacterized protein KY384_000112 [Bacidia gigantensis]KAG8526119.1 hypothetical protein KY384_000112 [Bacidia gigantensis]
MPGTSNIRDWDLIITAHINSTTVFGCGSDARLEASLLRILSFVQCEFRRADVIREWKHCHYLAFQTTVESGVFVGLQRAVSMHEQAFSSGGESVVSSKGWEWYL